MTTSMGRADIVGDHHWDLCKHNALVVIVATKPYYLAVAANKQREAVARRNS